MEPPSAENDNLHSPETISVLFIYGQLSVITTYYLTTLTTSVMPPRRNKRAAAANTVVDPRSRKAPRFATKKHTQARTQLIADSNGQIASHEDAARILLERWQTQHTEDITNFLREQERRQIPPPDNNGQQPLLSPIATPRGSSPLTSIPDNLRNPTPPPPIRHPSQQHHPNATRTPSAPRSRNATPPPLDFERALLQQAISRPRPTQSTFAAGTVGDYYIPHHSRYVDSKIRKDEYFELFYLTLDGMRATDTAESISTKNILSLSMGGRGLTMSSDIERPHSRKRIIPDEDLSFEDLEDALRRAVQIQHQIRPDELFETMWLRLLDNVRTNQIWFHPLGKRAIVLYIADIRIDFYRNIANGQDNPNLAVINDLRMEGHLRRAQTETTVRTIALKPFPGFSPHTIPNTHTVIPSHDKPLTQ